jgi:hypothetical protein
MTRRNTPATSIARTVGTLGPSMACLILNQV